jgi:hypothetical protein
LPYTQYSGGNECGWRRFTVELVAVSLCHGVAMSIVTCFLSNATRKFTWVSDLVNMFIGHSLFTLTDTIIRTYNVNRRFLFKCYTCTANLGEMSSAQLGAQLSLALVEAKLTGLLSHTN